MSRPHPAGESAGARKEGNTIMTLRYEDVSDEAAEGLAESWGYSDDDDSWSAMVGWAAGLLHDGSDDETDES